MPCFADLVHAACICIQQDAAAAAAAAAVITSKIKIVGRRGKKNKKELGVFFKFARTQFILRFWLPFLPQMSLMASLSNPYIVEYKDGWVDEVQTNILSSHAKFNSPNPNELLIMLHSCPHVVASTRELKIGFIRWL